MHIDPVTFSAQVVNFLILVAILKRFLYRPLLNAMAQRDKIFAERQAELERKLHDAEEAAQRVAAREAELLAHQAAALEQVAQDAEAKRQEYEVAARRTVDAEAQAWRKALEQQRTTWLESVRRELLDGVVSLTRQVLTELASTALESAEVDCLLQRLGSLSTDQQAMLRSRRDEATVHTTAALSRLLQTQVETVVRRLSPSTTAVGFVVDRDGLGVEVTWPGYRLGWTADGYIQEVVSAVGQLLDGVTHVAA